MNKQRQTQKEQLQPSSSQNQNNSVAPPRGENSGMWGWLENTGDWIADQYNSVTDGVSEWAGGVRDKANEVWDVVESSNFSAKDGIWSLETDLDEIQDIAQLEGISLDREASDNTVTMEVNRNTGVLTLKCANLAINSLTFEGFSVQGVTLSDVHIEVENASVDAGFLGTLSAKKGGQTNAPQNVTLRAASVIGHGVHIEDPSISGGEPITVDTISLESFALQANGSKELFEDAPNQASFSVANAVLNGIKLHQSGHDLSGDVAMAGASASFDKTQGTANLGINDLQATQLVAGQNQVESSHFKGVQGSVAPSGSGHSASISAQHAAVQGVDLAAVDANSLTGSGIGARYNTGTQALSASAGNLQASGLSGMGGSASSVGVDNIQVAADLDDNQQSASLGSISATDLQHGSSTVGSATLNNLAASSTSSGTTATLEDGTVSALSAYGHTADKLSVGGASVSSVGNTSAIKLNSGSVDGYSSEFGAATSAAISNVDLQHNQGTSSGTIGNVSASNVSSMGTSVGSISLDNTAMSHSNGGSNLTVDHLSAQNISGHGGKADSISLSQASAHGNKDLTQSGFNVGQLSGSNLSHEFGTLGNMSLTDIQGSRNNNAYQASLGTISGANADLKDIGGAQSIVGSNASVQATLGDQTTYSANLDTLSATGMKGHTFGTTIDSASFSGASFSGVDTDEMRANLDSGEINNFAMQGATIENAAIKNAKGSLVGERGGVSLEEVNFQNAQYEDMLRVGSGVARHISTTGTADSQQGTLGNAMVNDVTVVQPQSVSQVGQASLTNGQFTHAGNGKGSMGVEHMGARDIQVDVSDMDKTSSVSGATAPPIADVDLNQLISSGARRLDNASIQAEVGLKEGTIGSGMASVGVDQGTALSANINVANNRIQDGSSITANQALDTVAFTSVKGGYVEDGELKADVRGWFDMGISENINGMMGLNGEKLHSIGDYASAISQMPEKDDASSMDNPIDMSTLRATGNASLSDGVVSAGDASLKLAGASEGSNQMSFEATSQQIAMKFAQLLASSFQLNTALGSGQTGEVAVDNGSFTVSPQKGTARGVVDGVSVSDIQIQNQSN